MIKIIVNGRVTQIVDNANIYDIVVSYKVKPEVVIAMLNERVISKELWMDTVLKEGDNLELISIVGGG